MTNNLIVSGMRPTGRLHLGNYNSVIKNWIKLQNNYTCFFFIADIHALTNNFNNLLKITYYTKLMITEWLASGINPEKCNIFIQSHIKETFELNSILSMITPVSWLERIPAYKIEKDNKNKTYGFLGYPILQGADILILNANYVPVGEDQLPHLETIRELARKFNNYLLSINKEKFFKEPLPLLYKYKNIIGIDGNKMSKSKNNTILISDTSNILENKIKKLITDPKRITKSSLGNPEVCSVWSFHKIYSNKNEKTYINISCKSGNIGCVECKNLLYRNMEKKNNILIKKIKLYEKKESYINDVIINGIKNTREKSKITINNLKKIMELPFY